MFGLSKRITAYISIAVAVVLFLIIVAVVTRCSDDDDAVQAQADQGNRSAVATAVAASNAVETAMRNEGEAADIDTAVKIAEKDIGNAQNSDDVHAAVVRAWCMRDVNRSDPACKL